MKGLGFMIFGTELRQRLCLAAGGAVLLSVAGFSGATPAWAAEDTNMFNSVLGFVGMQFDKEPIRSITGPGRQSSFRRAPICRHQKRQFAIQLGQTIPMLPRSVARR